MCSAMGLLACGADQVIIMNYTSPLDAKQIIVFTCTSPGFFRVYQGWFLSSPFPPGRDFEHCSMSLQIL